MIGYRMWNVYYHIGKRCFILYSPAFYNPWNRDVKAVCVEGDLEEHLSSMEHTCGLYSYKSPSILFEKHGKTLIQEPIDVLAAGTVFNYGIVAEYSEGYRSSHSLIDAIFLPEYDCLYCYLDFHIRKKGEFIQALQPPHYGRASKWILISLCLNHLPEPLETPEWETFPIEVLRIELGRYYQVPVRKLEELRAP